MSDPEDPQVVEVLRATKTAQFQQFRSEIERKQEYDGRVPREWIDAVHNVIDVMEKDPDEMKAFWEEPDRVDWRDR